MCYSIPKKSHIKKTHYSIKISALLDKNIELKSDVEIGNREHKMGSRLHWNDGREKSGELRAGAERKEKASTPCVPLASKGDKRKVKRKKYRVKER